MLYIGIFCLLLFNLLGGVLIKYSSQFHSDVMYLSFIFFALLGIYGLRALIWLLLGKRYQLSFVYPFLGINYILSLFVGIALFNEPIIPRRFAGAMIILLGVTILTFSRHRHESACGEAIK